MGAGAVFAGKKAVVATGDSQAIGAEAQVGQMIGRDATVGNATIQFGGNMMKLKEI